METVTLSQIAVRIIKEQALIIGPLAWEEAQKVPGLRVTDRAAEQVAIDGANAKDVINNLVAKYEQLFGRLSHEICKEVVQDLIAELPKDEVPASLL